MQNAEAYAALFVELFFEVDYFDLNRANRQRFHELVMYVKQYLE